MLGISTVSIRATWHSTNHIQEIILARQQQYAVGERMRRLLKLMAHVTAEDIRNRVEFLSAWGES